MGDLYVALFHRLLCGGSNVAVTSRHAFSIVVI